MTEGKVEVVIVESNEGLGMEDGGVERGSCTPLTSS